HPSGRMRTSLSSLGLISPQMSSSVLIFRQNFRTRDTFVSQRGNGPCCYKQNVMDIKQHALGGFAKDSDETVLVKGKTVLLAMTGNPNFPTPEPALDAVTDVVNDYEQKLAMAKRRGSPEDTALKNQARKLTIQLLKRLAFYVSQTADGDLAKLLSSGFAVSSLPQRDDVP